MIELAGYRRGGSHPYWKYAPPGIELVAASAFLIAYGFIWRRTQPRQSWAEITSRCTSMALVLLMILLVTDNPVLVPALTFGAAWILAGLELVLLTAARRKDVRPGVYCPECSADMSQATEFRCVCGWAPGVGRAAVRCEPLFALATAGAAAIAATLVFRSYSTLLLWIDAPHKLWWIAPLSERAEDWRNGLMPGAVATLFAVLLPVLAFKLERRSLRILWIVCAASAVIGLGTWLDGLAAIGFTEYEDSYNRLSVTCAVQVGLAALLPAVEGRPLSGVRGEFDAGGGLWGGVSGVIDGRVWREGW